MAFKLYEMEPCWVTYATAHTWKPRQETKQNPNVMKIYSTVLNSEFKGTSLNSINMIAFSLGEKFAFFGGIFHAV